MIEGVLRIPLQRFEDERGWFYELRRESGLPKPTRQTNVSFSRQGTIRGLHYHERGQDDEWQDIGEPAPAERGAPTGGRRWRGLGHRHCIGPV